MGVQVCVVVVLMPDVLVSCFCMGLLLCSSSLKREEDVEKLYATHAAFSCHAAGAYTAQDGDGHITVVEADT